MKAATGRCTRNDRGVAIGRERILKRSLVLRVHIHKQNVISTAENHSEGACLGEFLREFGATTKASALVALIHRSLVFAFNYDRKRCDPAFGVDRLPRGKNASHENLYGKTVAECLLQRRGEYPRCTFAG